jgi:gelsolin
LEQTLIATGSIKREMFNSNDVFVFNAGVQLFLWVGKGASKEERKSGMSYAIDYLVQNKLPATIPIR